ncbi:MAG: acetate uptake transporter [Acidimicrobiaceae bacterium]|nr:acetate uptake transporter [Acidimicrobiaceae bacterium]
MATTLEPESQSVMRIGSLPPIADPAPLGLAAFALTTFLLSAKNANWTHGGDAWLGYAFAYGGAAQLLAGMWEFRNRNVFGATAFSTYGGFWIGLGLYLLLAAGSSKNTANDLGWILMGFLIVNTYLMICSLGVSVAVFLVFLTLEATELILVLGNLRLGVHALPTSSGLIKAGGVVGVVTAAVAWYTSFAGVANGLWGRTMLPVGRPLVRFPAAQTPVR